ncbi:MAG TPA: TlpA disulfide reductase family protein [Bryobacteraceae bacterium]
MAGLLLQSATQINAQTAVKLDPAGDASSGDAKEQYDLSLAISEAGASSIDLIRAIEQHLKKYPDSKQRAALEKNLLKAAAETNDTARIILYGERVLDRETPPDRGDTLDLLDRVARALVEKNDSDLPARTIENAKRAILYANRYENDVDVLRAAKETPGHLTAGQWSEELDKALARSQALEARATGYAGDPAAAEKIAAKSWKSYPTGEGARENAFWLDTLGRKEEAIEFYADAFTLEDKSTTEADRARDRKRLGELYSGLNSSEKGLGDVILAAYDRTSALVARQRADLKAKDPNAEAVNLADFILPPIDKTAQPLVLSALKGKTVVMDFWATWCAPCRAQQPLIEKVEKQYDDAPDVLFVAVDSDDDPSLVAPFVKEQGWKNAGYFEAGLERRLNIASIPTVLVIDPNGRISSRMIGFIPERFEQMLTERVNEARASATAK